MTFFVSYGGKIWYFLVIYLLIEKIEDVTFTKSCCYFGLQLTASNLIDIICPHGYQGLHSINVLLSENITFLSSVSHQYPMYLRCS